MSLGATIKDKILNSVDYNSYPMWLFYVLMILKIYLSNLFLQCIKLNCEEWLNLAVPCPTGGKGEAFLLEEGIAIFVACFVGEKTIGLWEDLGPFFISASQVLGDPEQGKLWSSLYSLTVWMTWSWGVSPQRKDGTKKNSPVSKETDQGICLSNPEF